MIRVGRFEVDEADRRGGRHLLRSAFVPRSVREAMALRVLGALERRGMTISPGRLARPTPEVGPGPGHAEALAAVTRVLGESVESPLAMAQAAHARGERRLLFLWRRGEADPFAIAKVARDAVLLEREARGLSVVADLGEDIAAGCPRLLAEGVAGGLAVLVESVVAGLSLARLHRLRMRAGSWHPAHLAAAGNWLGRFHSATARETTSATGQRMTVTAAHGDAWSRNVIVRPGGGDGPLRLLAFVDWEAFDEEADPVSDALHFVVESARADLAGRGPRAERMRESRELTLRWLLLDGSPPFRAVRAFFSAWHEALSRGMPTTHVREAAVAWLRRAGPAQISPRLVEELLSTRSALP